MAKSNGNKNLAEKTANAKAAIKASVKSVKRRTVNSAKGADKHKSNSKVSADKLELLITVVNRQKAEFYTDLLQAFDVNMQMTVRARGTASGQALQLLGLEDSPKSVIFSVIREDKLPDALTLLGYKFRTIKDGAGVAYTVPLTSVIGVALFGFLSNNAKTVKESK